MIGLLTMADPRAPGATVYLDGQKVDNCFVADDRHGWLVRYTIDAEGQRCLTWPPCGHDQRVPGCVCLTFQQRPVTEVLTGAVRIELAGGA